MEFPPLPNLNESMHIANSNNFEAKKVDFPWFPSILRIYNIATRLTQELST